MMGLNNFLVGSPSTNGISGFQQDTLVSVTTGIILTGFKK